MTKKKSVADRLAIIQGHRLRRKILQAAREAHAQGRLVSPNGLHKELGVKLGNVSYHVKVLKEEGALTLLDAIPVRGAQEHLYGINPTLLAEITDSLALDLIAELVDDERGLVAAQVEKLKQIIRSTGRPVEG